MPWSLERYHQSKQSHFLTFSCYHRLPNLQTPYLRDLFLNILERTRIRFGIRVFGYVVMPEHVHLLLSEPEENTLSDALRSLKLSFSKAAHPSAPNAAGNSPFWQKRYYDHNIRNYRKFVEKLRYIHRNPVKRELVPGPADWPWSSFRHYATGIPGPVEIESEWTAQRRPAIGSLTNESSAPYVHRCPTSRPASSG